MLIDTNIFLEILFVQEQREDCINLVDAIANQLLGEDVFITSFSLGAIESAARKKHKEFIRDLLLLIYDEKMKLINLDIRDHLMINSIRDELDLDFDDALQFVATQKYGTYIVTYDKHFSNKPIEVKTPKEILEKIIKDYK